MEEHTLEIRLTPAHWAIVCHEAIHGNLALDTFLSALLSSYLEDENA